MSTKIQTLTSRMASLKPSKILLEAVECRTFFCIAAREEDQALSKDSVSLMNQARTSRRKSLDQLPRHLLPVSLAPSDVLQETSIACCGADVQDIGQLHNQCIALDTHEIWEKPPGIDTRKRLGYGIPSPTLEDGAHTWSAVQETS